MVCSDLGRWPRGAPILNHPVERLVDAEEAGMHGGANCAYAAGKRAIVRVNAVERTYHVADEVVHALRGVTLDVYAGEYLSIMGPSGSGKSTLFNMIGGLDRPTRGEVTVQNIRIADLTRGQQARLRNRCIGYIFQSYNLVPVMTALENVALPMLLGGMETMESRRKAQELLELVGLEQRLDHRPDELSGGQQQRVAIARCLANDPPIILADEPTGNLDTKTGEDIIERLSQMSRQRGVTVISATHDHKMLAVSDRVVTIRDGLINRIELRDELRIEVGTISGRDGGPPNGSAVDSRRIPGGRNRQ